MFGTAHLACILGEWSTCEVLEIGFSIVIIVGLVIIASVALPSSTTG